MIEVRALGRQVRWWFAGARSAAGSEAVVKAFPALRVQGLGVVDVGARGGIHAVVDRVAPVVKVVGFEPDVVEAGRLKAESAGRSRFKSVAYLPYALGRVDGEQILHMCRAPGCSSFYEPNQTFLDRFPGSDRFNVVATMTVPVRSLDSLMADPAVRLPEFIDFMKLDTQGSELEILYGAERVLRRDVVALEVEVEFASLYTSQAVFRDVDAFLFDAGFTLFKLRRQEFVRRTYAERPDATASQVVFGDALYLRDPLDLRRPWTPSTAHQLEALILIAVLYDLHDFAVELLAVPRLAELVDRASIGRWIERRSRRLRSLGQRLRAVRGHLSAGEMFRRYPCRSARGDLNFYSPM